MQHLELARKKGQATAGVVMTIVVGVVLLFVGVFVLASVEPVFQGRLTECSYSDAAGDPEIDLNGTDNESALQNYTITAVQEGLCTLSTTLENTSEVTGDIYVYTYPTGTLITTITPPTDGTTTTTGLTVTAGTYALNYTFIGDGDTTVTTDSYVRCCTSYVAKSTPAGQIYNPTAATAGTAFSVFGLLLIVVGLAYAVGALKNMT